MTPPLSEGSFRYEEWDQPLAAQVVGAWGTSGMLVSGVPGAWGSKPSTLAQSARHCRRHGVCPPQLHAILVLPRAGAISKGPGLSPSPSARGHVRPGQSPQLPLLMVHRWPWC